MSRYHDLMTAGPHIPLLLSALLFAGFAAFEWRRLPVWARVHLGVATAFAMAAIWHPGTSIHDLLDHSRDGVAYVVGLARVAGLVAALMTISTRLRDFAHG
ncbi:MAG: hypothetical protein QOK25_1804 [Thermoleophilaceae bacterium]|nr:hypothetical protein [Thermoleophilaceae bacterium]